MKYWVCGIEILIDTVDLPLLNNHPWRFDKEGYVVCAVGWGKDYTTLYLHREIMKPKNGFVVDHKDGNKLNYRRENLRVCSYSQNNINKPKKSNCSSIYRGVSFNKRQNDWEAYINLHGKRKNLGRFKNEKAAAYAYDEAAKEIHGEFAKLNFPESSLIQ